MRKPLRPDIEDYKNSIKECCGRKGGPSFCESWGCQDVAKLIRYIDWLEEKASQQEDSADCPACKDAKPDPLGHECSCLRCGRQW